MIPMHRTLSDDIFARFLVIMKKFVISIMKEYGGPALMTPCGVIDDVIVTKKTFLSILWGDLIIAEDTLKLCLICQNFQNDRHFELATNFLPEVIPEVQYTRKKAISFSDILNFD